MSEERVAVHHISSVIYHSNCSACRNQLAGQDALIVWIDNRIRIDLCIECATKLDNRLHMMLRAREEV
jgi:Zn ribbon nucleic-acid-binding protein